MVYGARIIMTELPEWGYVPMLRTALLGYAPGSHSGTVRKIKNSYDRLLLFSSQEHGILMVSGIYPRIEILFQIGTRKTANARLCAQAGICRF